MTQAQVVAMQDSVHMYIVCMRTKLKMSICNTLVLVYYVPVGSRCSSASQYEHVQERLRLSS